MPTIRTLLKHVHEPTIYAVEQDADSGLVLGCLDVTREVTTGGLCAHLLESLPLAGAIDDVKLLNATRDAFDVYAPDCGNVHHLLAELLQLERTNRAVTQQYALADAKAKALKKDAELSATKVHALLQRIGDRQPLPLFDAMR